MISIFYCHQISDIELKKRLPQKSESATITFPFHYDNGKKIIIGDDVSIKENCVFLDGPSDKGSITIGANTLIGPYVQIYTPYHPFKSPTERFDKHSPVTVGANCKIGRESILCPGAEVGNGCVIAAGSVVVENHPIPENCLAGGTPCKVIKQLEEGEDVDSYINTPKGLLTPKPSHHNCYTRTNLEPPFHFDYGSKIDFGEGVYINGNCTFFDSPDDGSDDGWISIGNYTRIGPSVQIYTSEDSLNPTLKNLVKDHQPGYQSVKIGNNCWIGGGAIIFPGVKIGDCTTIGAGSVVTNDILADCIAAGNPCCVIKNSPY
jgi:nodulation protein l